MAELSNHQAQDILDDMGMIDENGNCPYTAEEIFKSGVEYAYKKTYDKIEEWLKENFFNSHAIDCYGCFLEETEVT